MPPARRRLGLAISLVALLLCLALPPLFDGLSARGQRALVVTVITVVLWTSSALDAVATEVRQHVGENGTVTVEPV